MGLSRSTFDDAPPPPGAALRHQGVVVNGKKLRRLMREHGLQPKRRRRCSATTDSDHAGPFFPDRAQDVVPERPNQPSGAFALAAPQSDRL